MNVVFRINFDDEARALIALYFYVREGQAIPRGALATRKQIQRFLDQAVDNHYMAAQDEVNNVEP